MSNDDFNLIDSIIQTWHCIPAILNLPVASSHFEKRGNMRSALGLTELKVR